MIRTGAMPIPVSDIFTVVTGVAGCDLYFSRHQVPFGRDGADDISYYKRIVLYGYTLPKL